jgi:hypothetical protein
VAGVGGEAEVDAAVGGGVHRVRKQSMKEKSVGVSGAGATRAVIGSVSPTTAQTWLS